MESYRSGHNGAVLKTVRAQVHAGSNPALSANWGDISREKPDLIGLFSM